MAANAVSNTGPIMHLSEIGLLEAFNIFSMISIPEEVANELNRSKFYIPKKIKLLNLKSEWKDVVKVLTNQYNLDLGESEAIALALQEKADYFLTDDLDARNNALSYYLKVHGTVGIILRAFREKIIDKKTAIKKVNELHMLSSLFITQDLIREIINSIENFSDKKSN